MRVIEIESGELVMDKILAELNSASVMYSVYDCETKMNHDIKFSKDDIVTGKINDHNKVMMFKDGQSLLTNLYGLNSIAIHDDVIYLFRRVSETEYKVIMTEGININNELQFYNVKRMLHDNINDDDIFKIVSCELKRIYYNKIS